MVDDEVLPLRAMAAADIATGGGKAANLGELIRIGMPVPDGFVITTAAYRRVAASDAGLRPGPSRPLDGLRTSWATAPMPDDLRVAITTARRTIGSGPVAVRSSATAEDLPGAAFAGQQDTYLDIAGDDELIDAVRRCWARCGPIGRSPTATGSASRRTRWRSPSSSSRWYRPRWPGWCSPPTR